MYICKQWEKFYCNLIFGFDNFKIGRLVLRDDDDDDGLIAFEGFVLKIF